MGLQAEIIPGREWNFVRALYQFQIVWFHLWKPNNISLPVQMQIWAYGRVQADPSIIRPCCFSRPCRLLCGWQGLPAQW